MTILMHREKKWTLCEIRYSDTKCMLLQNISLCWNSLSSVSNCCMLIIHSACTYFRTWIGNWSFTYGAKAIRAYHWRVPVRVYRTLTNYKKSYKFLFLHSICFLWLSYGYLLRTDRPTDIVCHTNTRFHLHDIMLMVHLFVIAILISSDMLPIKYHTHPTIYSSTILFIPMRWLVLWIVFNLRNDSGLVWMDVAAILEHGWLCVCVFCRL